MTPTRQRVALALALAGLAVGVPVDALAAGSGMPWEAPLEQILDSLTGPVARTIAVLAIVFAGLGMAFSEGGGNMRRVLMLVLGISIAFAASTFFLAFFGFAGGLTV